MTRKLGLGTMGMNFENHETSTATIARALDLGITHFNTGDFYQRGQSQVVLGQALKGAKRDDAFVSLKFGVTFTPTGAFLDVNPKNIKGKLVDSLSHMGLSYVDLYQPARQDTAIPVEDIVGQIKTLVDAGYVRNIGLSEVDAQTLRRAHAVHPIHSVEVEYSLLNREIERELIATAKQLGVDVVVYGAVGHGVLTDKVFDESVSNPMLHRGVLSPEHRQNNLQVLKKFDGIARSLGLSMSELALAWTQAKYDNVVSLIGTTKPNHLESSVKAIEQNLDKQTVELIENTVSPTTIGGVFRRNWVFTNGIGRLV